MEIVIDTGDFKSALTSVLSYAIVGGIIGTILMVMIATSSESEILFVMILVGTFTLNLAIASPIASFFNGVYHARIAEEIITAHIFGFLSSVIGTISAFTLIFFFVSVGMFGIDGEGEFDFGLILLMAFPNALASIFGTMIGFNTVRRDESHFHEVQQQANQAASIRTASESNPDQSWEQTWEINKK
jgi:hypothetical protein